MLIKKIESDLISAIKQKDMPRLSVLRLLKAAIMNKMAEKNVKSLNDSEITALLRKDVARHHDSIEQFKGGGRDDLAKKEEAELEILKSYLPKEPSPEEIRGIVRTVIAETNAAGKKDFGRVMKASMEKLEDSCAGKTLSAIVSELLGAS